MGGCAGAEQKPQKSPLEKKEQEKPLEKTTEPIVNKPVTASSNEEVPTKPSAE